MLAFPNDGRSYDATRRAVRFWGYDSALECWLFLLTEDALKSVAPGMQDDEAAMLEAFDSNREDILRAANRIYLRGTNGFHELGVADLLCPARAE